MRSARWCRSTAAPTTTISPAITAGSGLAPRIARWARGFFSPMAFAEPGFKFVALGPAHPGRGRAARTIPLTLVFGHSLYYWNQNVLIQHSETLKREYRILLLDYPEGFVEINSDDAKAARHPRRREDPAARRRRLGGGGRAGHARGAQRHRLRAVFRAPGAAADPRRDGERRPARAGSRGKGGRMKARILDRADVLKIVDLLRAAGLRGHRAVLRARARHLLRHGHGREPRPDSDCTCPIPTIRPSASCCRTSSGC